MQDEEPKDILSLRVPTEESKEEGTPRSAKKSNKKKRNRKSGKANWTEHSKTKQDENNQNDMIKIWRDWNVCVLRRNIKFWPQDWWKSLHENGTVAERRRRSCVNLLFAQSYKAPKF